MDRASLPFVSASSAAWLVHDLRIGLGVAHLVLCCKLVLDSIASKAVVTTRSWSDDLWSTRSLGAGASRHVALARGVLGGPMPSSHTSSFSCRVHAVFGVGCMSSIRCDSTATARLPGVGLDLLATQLCLAGGADSERAVWPIDIRACTACAAFTASASVPGLMRSASRIGIGLLRGRVCVMQAESTSEI